MKKTLLPALLLLCMGTTQAQGTQEELKERLKAHVYALASDEFEGRQPGTHGDTLAENYILAQLSAIEGVQLLGENGRQPFSYEAYRALKSEGNTFKIGKRDYTLGRDFIPSLSSSEGDFSGAVVDLGRGKAVDYQGKDVTGKFVLVHLETLDYPDPTEQRTQELQAIKQGAKGIIFVNQPLRNQPMRWPSGTGFLVLKVSAPVARELQSKKQLEASVAIELLTEQTANIVAKISAPAANNPDGDVLIIGAHFDHMGKGEYEGKPAIFHGADDNASGTSGIIELTRMLSERRSALKKDVIIILFGAEERGDKGSRYYANNPLEPLDKVKMMVNIDMMGRMDGKGITIRGVGSAHEGPAIFSTLPNNELLDIIWEFRGKGPTDYTAFYEKDIPSFSFSTRHHVDYHKPTDTRENINYDGMVLTYNYVENLINRMAFEPLRLTFKKTE